MELIGSQYKEIFMALKKKIELPNGFEGEYWVISQINIDWINRLSHLELRLFKNEEFRHKGDQIIPISVKHFDWKFDDFKFDVKTGNIFKIAYEKIKKDDDFFKDAEDV